MRTMLTLEIAGRLDEFVPTVFVRPPYERRRAQYYAELLSSIEPNDTELVEFGDRNGWRWGLGPRARAAARCAERWARHAARSLR